MRIELSASVATLMEQEGAVLMVRHLPCPERQKKELLEEAPPGAVVNGDFDVEYMEATIHVPGKLLVKTWCYGIEGALECLGEEATHYLKRDKT
jgi:hypothetical protein